MSPRSSLFSFRWAVALTATALIVGSAVALFLWSLDRATELRFDHPWLLYFLPAAGVIISGLYIWLGKAADGGNNLIIDQIHEPAGGVPLRMAPLILVATVVTHLFGGSAGREGTAVQMGGGIAAGVARWLRLSSGEVKLLLMSGIAAGFGAVFGTPLAGAVFAIEVLAVGHMRSRALLPCLIAAVMGDWTCHTWGIEHSRIILSYKAHGIEPAIVGKVICAAVVFGLASRLFSELSHSASAFFRRLSPSALWRPAIGGFLVIILTYALGTRDYLGLGVWSPDPGAAVIHSFFAGTPFRPWGWWWKMVFTIVTLSSGFKGGEVTPLFYIGAAVGHVLSPILGLPVDLAASLGFVAIFAGATNTPLACTLMGIELFGSENAVYFAVACFVAYRFSGRSGIYAAQRIAEPKDGHGPLPELVPLRTLRGSSGKV